MVVSANIRPSRRLEVVNCKRVSRKPPLQLKAFLTPPCFSVSPRRQRRVKNHVYRRRLSRSFARTFNVSFHAKTVVAQVTPTLPALNSHFSCLSSGWSTGDLPCVCHLLLIRFFFRSNPLIRKNRKGPRPLPRLESQRKESQRKESQRKENQPKKGIQPKERLRHQIAFPGVCLLIKRTEAILLSNRRGLLSKAFKPRWSRTPRFGCSVAHLNVRALFE